MVKAAEGAALGTGTTMDYEMIGGTHELLPNLTLQKLMYDNLKKVGGYTYTPEEREFAKEIATSLNTDLDVKNVEGINKVHKYNEADLKSLIQTSIFFTLESKIHIKCIFVNRALQISLHL